MSIITKEFIYTGGVHIAEVPHGTTTLTLHLWGGAGGGGGDDVGDGGPGSSGQYVTVTNLDISSYAGVKNISVTVGGGGGGGSSGAGAEGGENGKSLSDYSGGVGGAAGPNNPSGSGGGGGGATVVTVFTNGQAIDNTIVAIAGGGAGGGGGGAKSGGAAGSNTNSATANATGTLGENGAHHSAEGGGAGAGGGGADGGKGGSADTGDIGAFGGRAGSNTVPAGGSQANGSGVTPGGTAVSYYASGIAEGGAHAQTGGNGKAVLIFTIPAEAHYKVGGVWKKITGIHKKVSGTWKSLVAGYTKVSGVWKALFANDVNFSINYAGFGDDTGSTTSGTVGVRGSIPATPAEVANPPGGGGESRPVPPHKCQTGSWPADYNLNDPNGQVVKGYCKETKSDSCFIAGTMVRMADGTDIKIEDVIVGDMLKGKTSDNEVIALKPSTLGNQRLYAFNGSNNFFVTDEHPFWTKEGWKSINPKATKLYNELESGALSIGDYIQTLDGMIRIKSIESKETENKDLSLYNFEVSGDHSYFADRYCVHNKPKIICTKLFELGYLPQEVYTADQKFGEWLRENDPYAYFGYVKWASVVVEWMDKEGPQCMFWIRDKKARGEKQKALAISWAKRIATPWAQHMAYRMGTLPEDSKAGRMIMKFGLWLSRLIGKTTNTTTDTKSVTLGYSMWTVFGILYILAGIKGK